MQHFSVDFRTQQLQIKLRSLRKGVVIEDKELSELELADYLMLINDKFRADIESHVSLRHMIDTMFERTRTYFIK